MIYIYVTFDNYFEQRINFHQRFPAAGVILQKQTKPMDLDAMNNLFNTISLTKWVAMLLKSVGEWIYHLWRDQQIRMIIIQLYVSVWQWHSLWIVVRCDAIIWRSGICLSNGMKEPIDPINSFNFHKRNVALFKNVCVHLFGKLDNNINWSNERRGWLMKKYIYVPGRSSSFH